MLLSVGISRYQSLLTDHFGIKTSQQQRTPIIGYALAIQSGAKIDV